MTRSHKEVEILIIKLEHCLREAKLWSKIAPSPESLQSKLPFAVDVMSFEQWLQFIFIPKMSQLVSDHSALPHSLKLLPMAEQSFGLSNRHTGVLEVINQIDLIFADS